MSQKQVQWFRSSQNLLNYSGQLEDAQATPHCSPAGPPPPPHSQRSEPLKLLQPIRRRLGKPDPWFRRIEMRKTTEVETKKLLANFFQGVGAKSTLAAQTDQIQHARKQEYWILHALDILWPVTKEQLEWLEQFEQFEQCSSYDLHLQCLTHEDRLHSDAEYGTEEALGFWEAKQGLRSRRQRGASRPSPSKALGSKAALRAAKKAKSSRKKL